MSWRRLFAVWLVVRIRHAELVMIVRVLDSAILHQVVHPRDARRLRMARRYARGERLHAAWLLSEPPGAIRELADRAGPAPAGPLAGAGVGSIRCPSCFASVPRTGQVPYALCNFADCCGGPNGHYPDCARVDRTFCAHCGLRYP